MSIVFATSHVDLLSTFSFTNPQIIRRWDRELGRRWSKEVQQNLIAFEIEKPNLDPMTFPEYAYHDALLTQYKADKTLCYTRMVDDKAKNLLLIDTLAHEAALRRKAELELLINGRVEVVEVPEVTDPETGEVTQEYVAPVSGIDPLPTTIEVEGETVDNQAYLEATAELTTVQATIDGASTEVLALVSTRSS